MCDFKSDSGHGLEIHFSKRHRNIPQLDGAASSNCGIFLGASKDLKQKLGASPEQDHGHDLANLQPQHHEEKGIKIPLKAQRRLGLSEGKHMKFCERCGTLFNSFIELGIHVKNIHNEYALPYFKSLDIDDRIIIHESGSKLRCERCQKNCLTEVGLRWHRETKRCVDGTVNTDTLNA